MMSERVFDGTTTSTADFMHWGRQQPRGSFKPEERLNLHPENRDFQTEAGSRFTNKGVQMTRSLKPRERVGPPQPFEGVTTSSSDYQFWNSRPAEPIRPAVNRDLQPDDRDFRTENSHRFDNKGNQVRESCKPRQTMRETGPFQASTTSGSDFTSWDGAKPSASCKPVDGPLKSQPDDRDFRTEARLRFDNKGQVQPRESCAPKARVGDSQPFEGVPTSRADFPHWSGAKPASPVRQPLNRDFQPENRDFQTEAGNRFTNKGIQVRRSMKPREGMRSSQPFDGTTTNASDFQHWNTRPAESMKPPQAAAVNVEDRDFQTENARRFDHKGVQVRESCKPKHALKETAPFQGQSTTTADFPGWSGAKPAAPYKPNETSHDTGPDTRDFMSEARRQFVSTGPIQPRESCAPRARAGDAQPFEGVPTTRADFPRWNSKPATPVRPLQTREFQPESRDFQTEAANRFTNKGIQVRRSMKPKEGMRSSEPFDSTTTNVSNYPRWNSRPAESMKPPQTAAANVEDRDFQTENARRFDHKGVQVRESFKPKHSMKEPTPFQAQSTSTADFPGWAGAKPAALYKPNETSHDTGRDTRDFLSESRQQYQSHPYSGSHTSRSLSAQNARGGFNSLAGTPLGFGLSTSQPVTYVPKPVPI